MADLENFSKHQFDEAYKRALERKRLFKEYLARHQVGMCCFRCPSFGKQLVRRCAGDFSEVGCSGGEGPYAVESLEV